MFIGEHTFRPHSIQTASFLLNGVWRGKILTLLTEPSCWGHENSCPWCSVLSCAIAHLVVAVSFSMRTTGKLNLTSVFPCVERAWTILQRSPHLVIHNRDVLHLFLFFPTVILVRAKEFFKSSGFELVASGPVSGRNGSSQFHAVPRSRKYRPPT